MKSIILSLIIVISGLFSSSGDNNKEYQLKVRLKGLESAGGKVRIAVFSKPETFLTNELFRAESIEVEASTVFTELTLPLGTYAISAYHDMNNDSKLNVNFLGIPKEPYGFSNNPRRGIGPASFSESSFTFGKDQQELIIELK